MKQSLFVFAFLYFSLTTAFSASLTSEQWRERGDVYSEIGKSDDALIAYTRAIETDPQNSNAYASRGIMFFARKNYGLALKDFDRSLEHLPSAVSAMARWLRLSCHLQLNNNSKAIEDLDWLIENSEGRKFLKGLSKLDWAYATRGLLHLESNNRIQAVNDVTVAARLGNKELQSILEKQGIDWNSPVDDLMLGVDWIPEFDKDGKITKIGIVPNTYGKEIDTKKQKGDPP